MRTYSQAWRAFWSAVAAVGFGLAVLEVSVVGVVLTLGLLLVLCQLTRLLLPDVTPGWPSLTVAFGILTVLSFSWVSPALGLLVVLTAVLTSPAVVGRAVRSARRSTTEDAGGRPGDPRREEPQPEAVDADSLTPPEAMGPLKGFDDLQLCRLWRDSFWVMRKPPPGTVLRLVALRAACLDELERRDAAALHAWLESGARASGGPERYLTHPPQRDSGAG
jgi:hypothetical protein